MFFLSLYQSTAFQGLVFRPTEYPIKPRVVLAGSLFSSSVLAGGCMGVVLGARWPLRVIREKREV